MILQPTRQKSDKRFAVTVVQTRVDKSLLFSEFTEVNQCTSLNVGTLQILSTLVCLKFLRYFQCSQCCEPSNTRKYETYKTSLLCCVWGNNRVICRLHWHQHKQQKWCKHGAQWFSREQWHYQDNASVCSSLQAKGKSILNSSSVSSKPLKFDL